MRPLADLNVLVVDCQATGASPTFGHVLELGWGMLHGEGSELAGAEAHWIVLPEGHRVPNEVRKLTGYEPAFAATALADSEAWKRLRQVAGDATPIPTVIHYARFELAFLREWAARFEPATPFPLDVVCVHAIARRLYPELPRQSIRALAGYLGHSLELERRALGHVEATAFVWQRLRRELATRGIVEWEALGAFLGERAPAKAPGKKPRYPIERERYRSLPDAPGVYRFLRKNGDVLYVGKAASLKKRAASHFIGRASKQQAPEMLTQVSDIAVTVVGSALEAALLENETIKALRPPYNVQLTESELPVWYSAPEFDAAAVARDERHRIGPLPNESSLRPLGALIALAAGAPLTAAFRSHSVGVSALFTPDEEVFLAGWAELVARHPRELAGATGNPRRRALALARKLVTGSILPEVESSEVAASPTPALEGASRAWDPARVARHIERAAAQAYRAYRRAHWLSLVYTSDIVFREPGAPERRRLELREGSVSALRETAEGDPPTTAVPLDAAPRSRARFDRATYDRLRILGTELKRIHRDGGDVSVFLHGRAPLPARLLPGILRVT